jgi:hypothetical protein
MEISDFLTPLLFRLPLFLLWLVGIVFAVIRLRRHPKVSVTAIFGLLVLGFSTFLAAILPTLMNQLFGTLFRNRVLFDVIIFVQRVLPFLDVGAWILILFAIFAGRKAPDQNADQNVPVTNRE